MKSKKILPTGNRKKATPPMCPGVCQEYLEALKNYKKAFIMQTGNIAEAL